MNFTFKNIKFELSFLFIIVLFNIFSFNIRVVKLSNTFKNFLIKTTKT